MGRSLLYPAFRSAQDEQVSFEIIAQHVFGARYSSPYSVRRACAGSRRLARQAGKIQAHAAAVARTRTTVEKTLQSKGLMP